MLQLIHNQGFLRAKAVLVALMFVLFSGLAFANEEGDSLSAQAEPAHSEAATESEHHEQAEKKFDAGAMILEHIGDSHDWHWLRSGL